MATSVALVIAALFTWMHRESTSAIISQLDRQARALLTQVVITRSWIADHGGLYVLKQDQMQTSPYLPDTDIQDRTGKTYLFRNPAMVTREISGYASDKGLYRFRLSSLDPINPGNTPLPFEKNALVQFQEQGFEKTKDGIISIGYENGHKAYRIIMPVQVQKACLSCHAEHGYREGEIRGGLSVIISMDEAQRAITKSLWFHIASALGIIFLILVLLFSLIKRHILSPIEHLHSVANRMKDGEIHLKAELNTGDELEELANAYNSMTEQLKRGYEGSLNSLIAAIDARDPYTKGHTARVAQYAVAIAKEMGVSDEKLDEIRIGAILHDVGKIGLPDEILQKDNPLTNSERAIMHDHVQKGVDIISDADFLLCTIPAILHHHERYDGTGYPNGLNGEQLPLISKIMAVADTFDAMTTDRPYRKALPHDKAIEEIKKGAGSQFDPEVVKGFCSAHKNGNLGIE